MDLIYVIGHKNPDLDSVAAAISYSYFKNRVEGTDVYIPAIAGDTNKETEFALKKFGFDVPIKLEDAKDKKLVLVDHNETTQIVDGAENGNIIEILDHHKMNFQNAEPIMITVRPWGSSNTVVYHMMQAHGIEIDSNLAGLMLSAILVDTVILKSPTCAEIDKKIINEISKIAKIEDWKEYGMELFKIRSSVSELGVEDIIQSDFKDFSFKAGKVGIGQVETVDLSEFDEREDELLKGLEKLQSENNYHTTVLFITDIINEGSKFLVASNDKSLVAEAMGSDFSSGVNYIKGIISRKKQVAPRFTEVFDR